ncbi:unnamed protein product, partial [marine sediment metagenome]
LSEILKYDAFSYFPLTISILVGLIFFYIGVETKFLLWFFLAGLILVALSKILLAIYKPPNKNISIEEIGWQTKQKIIKNATNLDADTHIAKMYKVDDEHPVRKYIVNDELRNAVNLKNSKNGKLTFQSPSSIKTLHYSIGWNAKNINHDSNLKLYLCNDKSEKMIFNKDASNVLSGWNEYQIMLPIKSKIVEIRWENCIKNDIYLSISNLSPIESKEKRKNIVTIIFDGVIPDTIGLFRGRFASR